MAKINKKSTEKAVEKVLKPIKKKKQLTKVELKQKELAKQWSAAVRNFTIRKNTVERAGYRVTATIKRPKRITKRDIEWINKQLRSKGKPEAEKHTKRLDITYEKVPKAELEKHLEQVPTPKKIRDTRIRDRLIEEGFSPDEIDYFTEQEEMSMQEAADFLHEREEAEPEGYGDVPSGSYYYDPDTGERLAPDDPRIFERNEKGQYKYEWDTDLQRYTIKIRDDLELHRDEPLTPEMLKDLQWSNFIGNFKIANDYGHFDNIDPTPYFDYLKFAIGQDKLFDILNEVSDYGSNVADISFWYEEESATQLEKLQTIFSLAQRMSGKDFSPILRDLAKHVANVTDNGNYSGSLGADRQINRGGRR